MLKIVNFTKKYGKRSIFSDFSFVFPNHGLVSIVGASGSGKTTLLNAIAGVDREYQGRIFLDEIEINKLNLSHLYDFRLKNIGYVFQNFNLLNLDTAFNNVFLPLDTISKTKTKLKKQRILDILKIVQIENLKDQKVNNLSGGEKQRVAIARALINDPKILLCDEPTGALDEKTGKDIFKLLSIISKEKLVIIATHDLDEAKKISDILINIETGKITKKSFEKTDEKLPLSIGVGTKKFFPNVTTRFKARYSLQKIKAKKYRSLITHMMLSLSLTGVGLSMIITNSVSKKVDEAFKAILNGNQIIMTQKNEQSSTFNSVYASSFKEVDKVYSKYRYEIDGIGANYMVNFEDFFKDRNRFQLVSDSTKFVVDALSTRNINDFKWLNEANNIFVQPLPVDTIEDDQVVLGITYNDMINICYNLRIQRNFTSLSHYIYENELNLVLDVENKEWQYDDEQIFKVVGIIEAPFMCLYHTNQLWNEVIFENMMRLPSDDDTVHQFPWEMFKIYYLNIDGKVEDFLDQVMYDEEFNDLVFERTNFSYNPILCNPGSVCNEKRVYLYSVDKNSVNLSIINNIKENIDKNISYYPTSDFGYASYSSNIFSGFSRNVFVSLDEDLIDQAIDADTQLNNEQNITINLPDKIIQGNFMNSLGNGLRFSSRFDNLIYGRKPTNLNEIVISKGLAEQLGGENLCLGKYLHFAGEISETLGENEKVLKEYATTKIVVVGVTSETKNYIYHNQNWTISFFRDKLGVSSFYLIPNGIVFEFQNKNDANEVFNKLISTISEYKFENAMESLSNNVQQTLEYANTILFSFSILATLISVLLLSTVLMLNILESKDEIRLFKFLGIKKSQINSIFTFQGMFQGFLAFLTSAIELFVVDIALSYVLGDYLNIGFTFSFTLTPTIVIFLLGVIIPFVVSKILLLFLNKSTDKI